MRKKGLAPVIVVIIFSIIIFVGIIIFIILTPTVKNLSQCLDNGNRDLVQTTQKGITEKWDERQACLQLKQSTERLLSCYENAEKESLLPISIPFGVVTLFNKTPEDISPKGITKLHNSECGKYPESKI